MKTPFKLSLTALALVQGLGLSVAHAQEDTTAQVQEEETEVG